MKKLVLFAILFTFATHSFAQSSETSTSNNTLTKDKVYIMLDSNIGMASFLNSSSGNFGSSNSTNLGFGGGAIIGYAFKEKYAAELDVDFGVHAYADSRTHDSAALGRIDIKPIFLYQPRFGSDSSAILPYVGGGLVIGSHTLTPDDINVSSSTAFALGVTAKAGVRALLAVLLLDLGLEYDITTSFGSNSALTGALRVNFGLGLMF